jgi:hypothetical protein
MRPFVEEHAPAIAQALADIVQERGAPCSVDALDVADRSAVDVVYVRTIGRRYIDDVNTHTKPLGFDVSYRDGAFACELNALACTRCSGIGSTGCGCDLVTVAVHF